MKISQPVRHLITSRIQRCLNRVVLAALLPLAVATAATASGPNAVSKPNIILILADDLGYECMGANGGESYKTPALDKIAQGGIRFEHCYAQPLCTPSRVQLMTGIYNVRNYVGWGSLDSSQTTFANLLKKAGYATCMAGKWQLGGERELGEQLKRFGFDESYLFPTGVSWHWGPSIVINGQTKNYPSQDYGPDLINEQACQFIERNKSKPFFLYYTEHLPHDPFLPTPDSAVGDVQKYATGTDRRAAMSLSKAKYFGGMVEYMDKLHGKLLATLDAQGLLENTIVIFTGDNGTGTGVSSRFKAQSMAGGKGGTTDAGTHVPLFVSWPAGIKKTGVCSDLVDFTDFLPTLCEAAGAVVPSELHVDGRSFLPQLRGERGTPREWSYCWFSKDGKSKPQESARNQRYKLYGTGELYDVSVDRLEKHPLAELSPEAQAARTLLQQALDRYRDARLNAVPANGKKAQ